MPSLLPGRRLLDGNPYSTLFIRFLVVLTAFGFISSTYAEEEDLATDSQFAAARQNLQMLPGENVDLFDGQLSWRHTDASVPGPGGLSLILVRSFNALNQAKPSGDHGIKTTLDWIYERPSFVPHFGKDAKGKNIDGGMILKIPGKGPIVLVKRLYERGGWPSHARYVATGSEPWYASVSQDDSGRRVKAYSPGGLVYSFEPAPIDQRIGTDSTSIVTVTDPHGNWIRYTDDGISTSFGPSVVYHKTSRKDQYLMEGEKEEDFALEYLSSVELKLSEDTNRVWNIGIETIPGDHVLAWCVNKYETPPKEFNGDEKEWRNKKSTYIAQCSNRNQNKQVITGTRVKSVARPDGLKWVYEYESRRHNRLKKVTLPTGASVSYTYQYVYYASWAIKTRTVTIPDGQNMSYAYNFDVSGSTTRVTKVTSPLYRAKFLFSQDYRTYGEWRQKSIYAADDTSWNSPLYKEDREIGYSTEIGFLTPTDAETTRYRYVHFTKKITVDNRYVTEFSDFTPFYKPKKKIERVGSNTRTTIYTYDDRPSATPFLIGLVRRQEMQGTGGPWVSSRTFNNKGKLESQTLNNIIEKYTYYTNGNLQTKQYQNHLGWNTVTYSDYYRGQPQTETYPEGITIYRQINPAGTIAWEMDGEGNKTEYEYDDLNRFKVEKTPGLDAVRYTYSKNRNTVSRDNSNYLKEITLDGLGRAILVKESGAGSQTIYQATTYDGLGRKTFNSYASFNANPTQGVRYSYDALGRVQTETVTATNDVTSYCYGKSCGDFLPSIVKDSSQVNESPFAVRVTDPRGYRSVFFKDGFGAPSTLWNSVIVKEIETGKKFQETTITRNIAGMITKVTQDGITRKYTYHTGSDRLHTLSEPERNMITLGYDASGNLRTRIVANVGTTEYTYDKLNQLRNINYPTGHDPAYSYYKNGLLHTLSKGMTTRSYTYTPAGLLDQETLTVDITKPRSFLIDYDYTSAGYLEQIDYPGGFSVDYGLSDTGEITHVNSSEGPLVSSVSYFPNGTAETFTLGNGVVVDQTLNDRQMVEQISAVSGSTVAADLEYSFDSVGNVGSIKDNVATNRSVTGIGYDGLNRLITANGAWGQGSFSYDAKGNLKNKNLGSLGSISYQYDGTTNRLINTSGIPYSFQYDDYGNVIENGRFTMVYDHSGDMLSISTNASPVASVADVNIDYEYDGNGLRAVEIHNDQAIYQVHSKSGDILFEEDLVNHVATNFVYFNGKMLAEIESDIEEVFYCDAGWSLQGNQCKRNRTQAANTSCPNGYSISGSVCKKTVAQSYSYSCPVGYSLSGTTCVKNETKKAKGRCGAGWNQLRASGDWYKCYHPDREYGRTATPYCDSGWNLNYNAKSCSKTFTSSSTSYCPNGYTNSGSNCQKTLTASINYSCPSGQTLSGSSCSWVETKAAISEGF